MADKLYPRDEVYSTEGPTCPHCGREFTPDEAHYFDSRRYTQDKCDECGKTFTVEVEHSTTWTTRIQLPNPPMENSGETGNARAAPAMTGTLPVAGAPTISYDDKI